MLNNRIETRTTNAKSNKSTYCGNLKNAITFLGHSEDKIIVKDAAEMLEIEIYKNGNLIFIGSKYELFELLTVNKS